MKLVETKKAPAAIGPYSQGFISNGFFYASGQIAINPETGEVSTGDIKEQTNLVCKNIGELLKAAGIGYENVIKTTCFLAQMEDFKAFNEEYEKFFISKPARSCVAVKQLPKNVLCEIEIIAEV